jgi:hypothetical protein
MAANRRELPRRRGGRRKDRGWRGEDGAVEGTTEAVAFAFDAGFGQFAESVEDTGVGSGVVGDLAFEDNGIELGEQGVHLGDGDTKAGRVQEGSVALVDDVGGEVEAEAHFFEPGLLVEPIPVPTGVPAGEVIEVELVSALGEFLDN